MNTCRGMVTVPQSGREVVGSSLPSVEPTTGLQPPAAPAGYLWAGVFAMVRHVIPAGARIQTYPEPPRGPGGRWAFGDCGEPAFEPDEGSRSAMSRWPLCPACEAKEPIMNDPHPAIPGHQWWTGLNVKIAHAALPGAEIIDGHLDMLCDEVIAVEFFSKGMAGIPCGACIILVGETIPDEDGAPGNAESRMQK